MATPVQPQAQPEGGAPQGAGGTNAFTRKLGPLPVWAWMGLGLAGALAYASWSKNKKAASTASESSTTGEQTADQTPPFIIQNITNEPPETAPGTSTATTPPPRTTLPWPPPVPPAHPTVPKPPAKKPKVVIYRVKRGDTLSSIAKKYHTTVDAIWKYNTTPGNRPASTIATLKKRGKNLIFKNEEIDIAVPQG